MQKTRDRLLKKGLSQQDVEARDGRLEAAIDKEIKKEFATQEHKRLKSEAMKRTYDLREKEKQKEEMEYWREVKKQEVAFREQRNGRVNEWRQYDTEGKKAGSVYSKQSSAKPELNKAREEERKRHKGLGLDESYKAVWR